MMKNRTAVIFGATGLVGRNVLDQLQKIDDYKKIKVFTRREVEISHNKIEVIVDNLESLNNISSGIEGDDLFCCLGTTIKKAGSQEAFRKVDLELPKAIAETACKNKIKNFIVISSIGANAGSKNFYLRTKGQMEEAILKNTFENIFIVRPSLILGKRSEFRLGESLAKIFSPVLNPFLVGNLKKYKAIHASEIAKAMIGLSLFPQKKSIFESNELHEIANSTLLR